MVSASAPTEVKSNRLTAKSRFISVRAMGREFLQAWRSRFGEHSKNPSKIWMKPLREPAIKATSPSRKPKDKSFVSFLNRFLLGTTLRLPTELSESQWTNNARRAPQRDARDIFYSF